MVLVDDPSDQGFESMKISVRSVQFYVEDVYHAWPAKHVIGFNRIFPCSVIMPITHFCDDIFDDTDHAFVHSPVA